MIVRFISTALVAASLSAVPGLAQTSAKFEIADVHVSPPTVSYHERTASGGRLSRTGIFDLRRATMLDLIEIAWGVDANKVAGGPSWLDMDRFDVRAKAPAGATQEMVRPMLQALLTERFGLVLHNDTNPVSAWALTAGKNPQLKQAEGADGPTCKQDFQNAPAALPDGPANSLRTISYACHSMTMMQLAERLGDMSEGYIDDSIVADRTGLKGAWDFTFRFTLRSSVPAAGLPVVTLFDAVEKQLGLKLEPATVPMEVIVVDRVNQKPTANSPEVAKSFPAPVAEFEVASVKPTAVTAEGGYQFALGTKIQVLPGGRVNAQSTMHGLIRWVWGLNDVMVFGLPPYADTDMWDIVAKSPDEVSDIDMLSRMLQTLLTTRFQLKFHMEERPVMAYTLIAAKPKLKQADPAERTGCKEGPATPTKNDPRNANPLLGRLLTCSNTSMSQLAYLLFHGMASGYVKSPVTDATGLEGGWDFTLSFSAPEQIPGGDPGGNGAGIRAAAASDPNGTVSLPDAMEKQIGVRMELQKRPVEVLVIDHVERKPTEN